MKTLTTKKFGSPSSTLNASLGTGDGSDTTFNGTLANKPVVPGSVVITTEISSSEVEITDNKSGVLSGDGVTGTINYGTGAWTLVFETAPDNSAAIACDYQYATIGPLVVTNEATNVVGSSSQRSYYGKISNGSILPNSVTLKVDVGEVEKSITDNNAGILSATEISSGSVNYNDGGFFLMFKPGSLPDTGATVTASYQWYGTMKREEVVKLDYEPADLVVIRSEETSYVHVYTSSDNVTYTYLQTVLLVKEGKAYFEVPGHVYVKLVSTSHRYNVELLVL